MIASVILYGIHVLYSLRCEEVLFLTFPLVLATATAPSLNTTPLLYSSLTGTSCTPTCPLVTTPVPPKRKNPPRLLYRPPSPRHRSPS